jgi:chromate transporter
LLALVVQAVLRIAGRALTTPFKRILAVASFIAVFFFNLPFPVVVLGAGAIGMIIAAWRQEWLALKVASESGGASAPTRVSGTMRIAAILIGAWALPFVAIALTVGPDHVLMQIAAFFSRLAVVTFGGAYAVLAYMAQEAVQTYHWLRPGEMADGLGLAETTPGPLIMVTQFVGFLGAYRLPEPFSPLVAGMLGALVTTWVTFVPCFLWIFTFAPWIERLEHAKRLQGGLAALTAAVVGVIANVALWFALHVLFWRVGLVRYGPLRFIVPDVHSPNLTAIALALLAFGLLFVGRIGVVAMLGLCGMAALMLRVVVHM